MATSPKGTGTAKTSIDAEVARSTKHTLNMALLIAVRGCAARPRGDNPAGRRVVTVLITAGLLTLLAPGDLSWFPLQ